MLSAEEKKEKEDFFRDLDHLEDLDDDGEEQADINAPESPPKRRSNKVNTNMPGSSPVTKGAVDLKRTRSRKRKPSREVPQSRQRASQHPRLTRASTLPEQDSEQKAQGIPRLARAMTLPEKGLTKPKSSYLSRTFTDLSNLEARLKGTELPKLRALPKGKIWKPLADIPTGKQIFQGLVFCK